MKPPSIIKFVLAHNAIEFVAGVVMTIVGAHQFWKFKSDPAALSDFGVLSVSSMIGRPLYAFDTLFGLCLAVWAWKKWCRAAQRGTVHAMHASVITF